MYATVQYVETLRSQILDLERRTHDIETWRFTIRHTEDIERKIEQHKSSAQLEKRFRNLGTQLQTLTRRVEELDRLIMEARARAAV